MKRLLFTILAVVSLLFCIGVTVAWSTTINGVCNVVNLTGGKVTASQYLWIGATGGECLWATFSYPYAVPSIGSQWGWIWMQGGARLDPHSMSEHYFWGFGYTNNSDLFLIAVPGWFLTLAFGGLTVLFAWRAWRKVRKPGTCKKCGYDLRASIDKCPECGAAIPDLGTLTKRGPATVAQTAAVALGSCFVAVAVGGLLLAIISTQLSQRAEGGTLFVALLAASSIALVCGWSFPKMFKK